MLKAKTVYLKQPRSQHIQDLRKEKSRPGHLYTQSQARAGTRIIYGNKTHA